MQYRHYLFTILIVESLLATAPGHSQTLLRVATPGALTGALPSYLGAIPPYKYFDLSLIQELKVEPASFEE